MIDGSQEILKSQVDIEHTDMRTHPIHQSTGYDSETTQNSMKRIQTY